MSGTHSIAHTIVPDQSVHPANSLHHHTQPQRHPLQFKRKSPFLQMRPMTRDVPDCWHPTGRRAAPEAARSNVKANTRAAGPLCSMRPGEPTEPGYLNASWAAMDRPAGSGSHPKLAVPTREVQYPESLEGGPGAWIHSVHPLPGR